MITGNTIHVVAYQQADVAFFFKQWGGTNKKKTGRVLEGRTWDEMPNIGDSVLALRD